MFSKNHPILIYLDRGGFILYQDSLANILQFPFSSELVKDLEVINKEQLIYLLRTFIQRNNIIPSVLIIILSDSLVFQKEIYSSRPSPQNSLQTATPKFWSKELQEREIQNFLENIPFEDVLAKIVKIGNVTRLVSVNKELVDTLTYAFRIQGSIVGAIVPSLVYEDNIDFTKGLTTSIAKAILRKGDLLKLANLLVGQQSINIAPNLDGSQSAKKEKPKNMRMYLLIIIFVILLIILGVVYISSVKTAPKTSEDREDNVVSVGKPQTTPSVDTVLISPPQESIDLRSIKIKISTSKEKETETNILKRTLLTLGFEDISIESKASTLPAKPTVLFTKDIPQDTRQKTIAVIKRVLIDVIIQENQEDKSIITIIIGAS